MTADIISLADHRQARAGRLTDDVLYGTALMLLGRTPEPYEPCLKPGPCPCEAPCSFALGLVPSEKRPDPKPGERAMTPDLDALCQRWAATADDDEAARILAQIEKIFAAKGARDAPPWRAVRAPSPELDR